MSSTVDNWKVVYLRLITTQRKVEADIIELAARFEGKEFSKWITPPIEKLQKCTRPAQSGLTIENGALFRDGKQLETIDLKAALIKFQEFVTSLQGPVLLVTHSSRNDMMSLFTAIQRTDMVDAFRGVINRVSNTLTIFTKVFPKLVTTYSLTLDQLIKSMLDISTFGKYLDSQFYLECLAKLITKNSISTFELLENSESYEEIVLDASRPSRSWVNNNHRVLIQLVSPQVMLKLKKSKVSYAILKDLKRKHNYPKFHEYLNKQFVANEGCKIPDNDAKALFRNFKEIKEREHEDQLSTSDLVELNAAGPSRIPDAPARYSNDHSANRGQQHAGSDEIISLIDEDEVPRYDKSYPFNKQQGELNAAGPSRIPDAPARYNDYSLTRGQQQEVPYEIHSLVEELATEYETTYSSIRDQEELGHDMEIQGPLYDYNYQFTEEHNELINDPASIMGREEPCNNDYSLTRDQQQELPYEIYSLVEELATEYETNYLPIREQEELVPEQEELVCGIERQEALYTDNYSLTRHQEERNTDTRSSMGESYLPINQYQRDQEFDPFYWRNYE